MPPYKQTDMVGPSGSGEKAGSRLEVSAGPSSLGTRKAAAVPVRTKSGLKRKPGPGRTCNKFTKTGRMRQCRDPAAPKRARTAFNFFLRDFRKTYLVSHAWNLPRLPSRALASRCAEFAVSVLLTFQTTTFAHRTQRRSTRRRQESLR